MCGIYGVVGGDDRPLCADDMRSALQHRGPDSVGDLAFSGGMVGQNRLAIIDVAGGDPPILNEDGTIGAVLNGEIYNFRELRARLERHHRFSTQCDTEVLVHLAEERNPVELARELRGMFSFAYVDSAGSLLVLGRDRVGKKPLYYWHDTSRLVFSSEIKGLLASGLVPRELDETALAPYLAFGYVPTPRTIFSGIRSLPPGHVLVWHRGTEPSLQRYWHLDFDDRGPQPRLRSQARQLRRLLQDAVRARMISDVPLGAFLSGGIDSSAVVALMAELSDEPVRTFTIGFVDDDGFDERAFARVVAQRYGAEHHEFVVRPAQVNLIEELVWHHDQPFGDSSALPTYMLSELTRKHVTVALCGDGGDELFGGYERFVAGVAAKRLSLLPGGVRSILATVVDGASRRAMGRYAPRLARFLYGLDDDALTAYRRWTSCTPDAIREGLTGTTALAWAEDDYRSIYADYPHAHELDRLLALNLRTYLLDDLLVKTDRMSMAHALEVRSPFLDMELVEFAFSLAPTRKARGFNLKRILKLAMKDSLPSEILHRRKHGFGIPVDRWFRDDLRDYVRATLGSPRASVRQVLRGNEIDRLLQEHDRGAPHGQVLWTLLTLEVFLGSQGW